VVGIQQLHQVGFTAAIGTRDNVEARRKLKLGVLKHREPLQVKGAKP
jgi:hypothetical protein